MKPGPVPKRSEDRIRRNKPEYEITRIEAEGTVEQPDLGFDDPHPITVELWESMAQSAQAEYYEPTDWAYAKFVLHHADQLLKNSRPSAQMFQGITSSFGDLLMSEGSRRRVAMEIERNKAKAQIIDISAEFRERMEQA